METIIVYQEGIETKALKNERSFEGFDNRIWAIIGETEKAYNILLGNAFHHVATWIPKSLVSVDNEPNSAKRKKHIIFFEDITLVCDFATAMEIAKETFKSFN